jgi:fatty-acyl-CoA synthase
VKRTVDDLALFGGPEAFPTTLLVGRPNTGDRARLFQRLNRVLDSGWLTNGGPLVYEFEDRVAELAGVRHAVATCNATSALGVMFAAAGLSGEVVMPSMTYIATAHAARFHGLQPVFCDIDPVTGCIDAAQVEALITPRTSAILGVHLFGQSCAVDALEKIATANNLTLLFDAAHGLGCTYEDRPIGGFGTAEVFSFHATKVVNAFEGGAIVTDDDEFAQRVRSAHNFGFTPDGVIRSIGTNAKMTEAAAAMGLTSLEAFEQTQAANEANYHAYRAALADVPGVRVHPYDQRHRNNYQYVVLDVDEDTTGLHRDVLLAVLRAEKVVAQRYFSPCCHQTEPYRHLAHAPLPTTERMAERVLALPTGPSVTAEQLDRIADVVRLACAHGPEVSARWTAAGSRSVPAPRREPVPAARWPTDPRNPWTGATTFTESYWPADTAEPVCELTVGELLRAAADEVPTRLAMVEVAPPGGASLVGAERTDRTWTYRALLAEAQQCAQWLLYHFLPGERITVWAPNVPEWLILQYGAALAGLVLVTANPALRAAELDHVLRQSRSVGLVHTSAFRGTDMTAVVEQLHDTLPELREVVCLDDWDRLVRGHTGPEHPLPAVRPGDASQIQYTSGTTGFPKGALLHHRGLVTNSRYVSLRLGFPAGGTWVSAMPLFHTAGSAMGALGCLNTRSTFVLCQSFDPEMVMQALQDWQGDCVFAVPTMFLAMLDHPRFREFDFGACSLALTGGSTVPPALIRRVEREFGCGVSNSYGQTELSPTVIQTSPADSPQDKADTIGRPLWQVEVKVVEQAGQRIQPVGVPGELCVRGYQRMLGYFEMPDATGATVDDEGWLHTGDLATMDERGFFRITGRLKDMIIRGGENIYPREIEDLLFAHPDIADAVVVGVPDERWGELPTAVLRPADPAAVLSVAALRDYCRAHLAPHKTPQRWFVTEEYPLTGSGKIQKYRVRELLGLGHYRELVS